MPNRSVREPETARPVASGLRPEPSLPPQKAFVVQFGREETGDAGFCAGRVEHLHSGRAVHFGSVPELLDFLKTVLDEQARRSK
jgi:hypothetical protein